MDSNVIHMKVKSELKKRVDIRFEEDSHLDVVENIEKLLLIYDHDCPMCEEVREYLKDRIETGEIGLLTSDDDETLKILNSIEIHGIPSVVARFKDGTYEEVDING